MTTSRRATGALAAASAAALVVALLSPMSTVVVGVILLGVLALVLELRYLVARLPVLGRRDVLGVLGLLLAGTVTLHLVRPLVGTPARVAESLAGLAVVGVVVARTLGGRRRAAALAVVGLAGVASASWPLHAAVALLHLHQLLVVVFLWDWSQRLQPRVRRTFRAVQVGWAAGVPALVLSGALDRWLSAGPGVAGGVVGDGRALLAASALPGHAEGTSALRLLTVLAAFQTLQLLVWVVFLPHFAPERTAQFEARFPSLTGARVWAFGFVAAALTAVVFAAGYARGQVVFGGLWSWAVHVELAAAVLVALGVGAADTLDPAVDGTGDAEGAEGAVPVDAELVTLPVEEPASGTDPQPTHEAARTALGTGPAAAAGWAD